MRQFISGHSPSGSGCPGLSPASPVPIAPHALKSYQHTPEFQCCPAQGTQRDEQEYDGVTLVVAVDADVHGFSLLDPMDILAIYGPFCDQKVDDPVLSDLGRVPAPALNLVFDLNELGAER